MNVALPFAERTSERDIAAEVPLEDCWFKLLSSQIDAVQTISATTWADGPQCRQRGDDALATLRAILQESFTSLVSVSSTKAVSFPRLFKRLVDSSAQSRLAAGTPYDEFRSILMSMLESYRSEGDMLAMTKRVLDDDIFDAMEVLARKEAMAGGRIPVGVLRVKNGLLRTTMLRKRPTKGLLPLSPYLGLDSYTILHAFQR